MNVDLQALLHLGELFDKLRSGRHLCADDGPLYLALRTEFEAYRAVFAALGFELVQHDRGFCYFRSDAELGKPGSCRPGRHVSLTNRQMRHACS